MKLTSIDAPLIRTDTSFGIRVFAGNTMIYGDTGWRALVEWNTAGEIITGEIPAGMVDKFEPGGMAGGLYLRRIMNRVYGLLVGDTVLSASNFYFRTPLEYRATTGVKKTGLRSMITTTPPTGVTPGFLSVGGLTYLLGLRTGMSAGGNSYPDAGTQWDYLVDHAWPTETSTYTPKNTALLT